MENNVKHFYKKILKSFKNRIGSRVFKRPSGRFFYFQNKKMDKISLYFIYFLLKKSMDRNFYHKYKWKKLRDKAVKRDKYRCVQCYSKGIVVTDRLEVDHILTIEDRPDLAMDIDNLRTLCRACHDKRHNRLPSSAKWADERYEW